MNIDKSKPRGFALLPAERRRELASMGGKRVQKLGKGHRWTSETARAAGAIAARNTRD